ncbi:hypothetical protein D3C85_15180 [compost metagenome]
MTEHLKNDVIDLVEVVKKAFPRINNNLSLKRKNAARKALRKKKHQYQDLFVSIIRSLL